MKLSGYPKIECGGYYGSKVWGSNTKYRRTVWRCNEKYKTGKPCSTPHLTEDEIKQGFLAVFNILMGDRDELLVNCRLAQEVLATAPQLKRNSQNCTAKLRLFRNSRENPFLKMPALPVQRRNRQNKSLILDRFIREIETRPVVVDEFDDKLWMVAVDKVTVHRDGRLEFASKDGNCLQTEYSDLAESQS